MQHQNEVGLFFYVKGRFLFHGCSLEAAEPYGEFLTYPSSHWEIWCDHHEITYRVDFDYFPRGRVTYRKSDSTYIIYHDSCITEEVRQLESQYPGCRVEFHTDEHYQCHRCNRHYVI